MNWQLLTTWIIVLLAVGSLLMRLVRFVMKREQSGCGSACGGCAQTSSQQVVTLQVPKSPADHKAASTDS